MALRRQLEGNAAGDQHHAERCTNGVIRILVMTKPLMKPQAAPAITPIAMAGRPARLP